jgi:uncharacterized protein (TIGR00369 family)
MPADRKWTMLSAIGGDIVEVRPGYARGILPLSEIVMQPTRVFHAGAITTLADEVASAAIEGGAVDEEYMANKLFPYSVQLSVNLLTNDPEGPLTAEARVVREGRMTVVQTVVTTAGGKTAALMTSTHMMVDLKKSGAHKAEVLARTAT